MHAVQIHRTRQCRCARCGMGQADHTGGVANCPDGNGSYTWALSRSEAESMTKRLEELLVAMKGN